MVPCHILTAFLIERVVLAVTVVAALTRINVVAWPLKQLVVVVLDVVSTMPMDGSECHHYQYTHTMTPTAVATLRQVL